MNTTAPKMKIAKIREIIHAGSFARNWHTGGTREEFARGNAGEIMREHIAKIKALVIPARFVEDIAEAAAEITRLEAVAARHATRRAEYLDEITAEATAFATFADLINAAGGYFPSLRPTIAKHVFLAKAYDTAQAARNDSRRAFLSV